VIVCRAVNPNKLREVAARLRECEDRVASPDFAVLYPLVLDQGRYVLRTFKKDFGADELDDIILGFLLRKVDAVVEAEDPVKFLWVVLPRAAVSRKRKKDAGHLELTDERAERVVGSDGRQPEVNIALGEMQQLLDTLSVRDREILLAVGSGEEPEEVAAVFHTSRANVYQIVSRFRRRFKREES